MHGCMGACEACDFFVLFHAAEPSQAGIGTHLKLYLGQIGHFEEFQGISFADVTHCS